MFRLELIPIVIGVIVGLIGLALIVDACANDDYEGRRNRRRAERTERSRGGEATIGLGVICMGAAFVGRDTWTYSVVAVIAGGVLLIAGAFANRSYLAQTIGNRGALRRRDPDEPGPLSGPPNPRTGPPAA